MNDYQNNYLTEAVRHKIKLFTKELYFKCFNHILTEKAKILPAFKKRTSISFSTEILLKEKEETRNKLKLIKAEKERTSKSLWYLIMILILNIPNKKKLEYKRNEFNLNPICYSYITNLCKKKIKLLTTFSNTLKIPLDLLVKFYLDLCINHINQKEPEKESKYNKIEKSMKINENKKLSKKIGSQLLVKKTNIQKNMNNGIEEKNKPLLVGPPLNYSNSFTRLFIGEIDPISVRERYLSNIVVKKLKQLHLYSSYQELSNMYLKRLYNKLFKKDNKGIVDKDMADILSKFKYDTKKVENYQRNALSFEKKNIRDNYIDEEKENLEKQLQRQKNLYLEQKPDKNKKLRKRKNKLISLSPIIIRNDNKIKFKFKKSISPNSRYKNNSSIITNNKSQYLSLNLSLNRRNRCTSAMQSRNEYKKDLSKINGFSHSSININNSGNNHKKVDYLLSNDLKIKKQVMRRTNNVLLKMKNIFNERKNVIYKKRKLNLKNFLKNDDFYFSNMD